MSKNYLIFFYSLKHKNINSEKHLMNELESFIIQKNARIINEWSVACVWFWLYNYSCWWRWWGLVFTVQLFIYIETMRFDIHSTIIHIYIDNEILYLPYNYLYPWRIERFDINCTIIHIHMWRQWGLILTVQLFIYICKANEV